ncbi:MAG: UDP-glucose/GDP-mannose dehydrogenase family protein [Alphaproteobacteria bacterium]|nr:UDP-glucose/GDP-mannose dehydrogenase family protein [Alphaproteobacteria bacterium]
MKIAIVGTGYVGLPSGVGFATLKHNVVCIDKDQEKIRALQSGNVTLYENGMEELFGQVVKKGNLKFTTSFEGVKDADVVILAVGTPPHPKTKEADMRYIYAAAEELAPFLSGYTVIADKSTVPVGTGDEVEKIIRQKNPDADFDVVSLPEFLREGYAIHDFFNPDRIVVGADSKRACDVIKELYKSFEEKTQILFVSRKSAETVKYASNAFLAMKIHYINEMADFCEKSGADIGQVAKGMGLDKRIGNKFLNAGPGYGGSCFPKDTTAMALMAQKYGVKMGLIETTIAGNKARKIKMAERIFDIVKDIKNPKIGVLGLAFKNGTDDVRESPAVEIISAMLEKGADITAFDYQATDNAKKVLLDKIKYAHALEDVFDGADVVAVLTEWEEFKALDIEKLASKMRHKRMVDLRNLFDGQYLRTLGFVYDAIGCVKN